jgi:hypothetical protein
MSLLSFTLFITLYFLPVNRHYYLLFFINLFYSNKYKVSMNEINVLVYKMVIWS